MKLTDNLQSHHKDLMRLATKIVPLLDEKELAKDARAVRELLSEFLGKLRIHLAIEDNSLYPRLLAHKEESIQAKARAFLDEMGGLKARFASYSRDWPTDAAISRDPAGFISATQELFYQLYKRMEKENKELHPMADQAGLTV